MRYYKITVTPPNGQPQVLATSHPNGNFDANAPEIQFDVLTINLSVTTQPFALITVKGIPLSYISSFTRMAEPQNEWAFQLDAGMLGPPDIQLAQHHGAILYGQIFGAWGNWIGTSMSLELLVSQPYTQTGQRGNFQFNWPAGQPLAQPLQSCLSAVLTPQSIDTLVNIGTYVFPSTVTQTCDTLPQLAAMILAHTTNLPGGPVYIAQTGSDVLAWDKGHPKNTVQLEYQNFIGQPTWIAPNRMEMLLVMRNDLDIGSLLTFPPGFYQVPGLVTTTQQAYFNQQQNNYALTFTGTFQVQGLRYIGSSRSRNATDWTTVVICVPYTEPGQPS